MARDYYEILGVGRSASQDEIKKAYRKLAHEHHPDKAGGNETKFKELNQAYQTLGNPEKRSQYDRFGSAFEGAGSTGAGPGGFRWEDVARQAGGFRTGGIGFDQESMGDLGDIFGDLFGMGGRRSGGRRVQRGADLEMNLTVSFHNAAFGKEEVIELEKQTVCSHCQGSGAEPGSKTSKCSTCNGQGQVERVQETLFGSMRALTVCPRCQGEGKVITDVCKQCRGEGVVSQRRTLKVHIPAGIADGQSIKLSGEGQAGSKAAPAGDLYIRVQVQPDARFKRKGDDVYSSITLKLTQAGLGDKIEVPTIDGLVALTIPGGTQAGRVFKLKNKGILHLHGRGRGDMFVTVDVRIPSQLDRGTKALFEELKERE